jgi:prefoldin subunit 5
MSELDRAIARLSALRSAALGVLQGLDAEIEALRATQTALAQQQLEDADVRDTLQTMGQPVDD